MPIVLQASASDSLSIITSAAVNTDISAHWEDRNGNYTALSYAYTPGSYRGTVATATTTPIVAAPSTAYRVVLGLTVRNRHASTTQTVTVVMSTYELISVALAPGSTLVYSDAAGFFVVDSQGRTLSRSDATQTATVNSLTTVVLASDVTNNNAIANTIADVTGLSFAVTSGQTYWFQFVIDYTSAVNTTGSRWSINGPTATRLAYASRYTLTATTETVNYLTAYDNPAASNASSLTGSGNIAWIEGFITPSANGTVIARFASEVSSSAIVAKAGSLLQWMRTL